MIGRRPGLALLVAAVLASSTSVTMAPIAESSQAHGGQVDRALRTVAWQRPNASVRVIVQARRGADASQAVARAAGTVRTVVPRFAGLAAEVRADQIDTIAQQPGVVRVSLDPPMRPIAGPDGWGPASVFTQTIGATQLWASGHTGRGVGIAILDSGLQPHLDFGDRIVHAERFNRGASSNADQLGHGTWVGGIAAGNGAASDGRYAGVAPDASIVNLKISDDTGEAYASDVLNALGWVAANHDAFNIRVVNLSLVSSLAEGYATNLLDAAVEFVWHSGVAVVVAAGNQGADTEHFAPANDPYVITVGASDDGGTVSAADDALAWFSSFGMTQDGFGKPDVVAPGRHIVGPLSNLGARLAQQYPYKVVSSRYIQLSGTSAAAPVVAGAVALLAESRPQLSPDQLKWLLVSTARPLSGAGVGAGELDVAAAARAGSTIGQANRGLVPNRLVGLAYLAATGRENVSWDSVSWDSVAWDSVSWDSVSWDSVSWDSVSWDSVSWDSVIGND